MAATAHALQYGGPATGFSATPALNDSVGEGDDRIRELKTSIYQRQFLDHYWNNDVTAGVNDQDGRHKQVIMKAKAVTGIADELSAATGVGFLGTGTDNNLWFKPATKAWVQITNGDGIGATGQTVYGSNLNTPRLSARSATNWTLTTGTPATVDNFSATALAWGIDSATGLSATGGSASGYTLPSDGTYSIEASCLIQSQGSATAIGSIAINVGGTQLSRNIHAVHLTSAIGQFQMVSVSVVGAFSASDFVQVVIDNVTTSPNIKYSLIDLKIFRILS